MKTAGTLRTLGTSRFCSTRTDMRGDRVNVLTIKWLRYLKEDQGTLLFKCRMADDIEQLKIKGSNTRNDRRSLPSVCHVAIAVSFC